MGNTLLVERAGPLLGGFVAVSAILASCPHSVSAQQAPALSPKSAPVMGPTDNATINLIRLLVEQHVITQEAAQSLINQAQAEAETVRRAAEAPPAPAATSSPGAIHVGYVPDFVKQQIRDEVKQEVLQTAKSENWAQPDALPDWLRRFKFEGDTRLRVESSVFDKENGTEFINFSSINNSSSGYDIHNTNGTYPAIYNSTKDRDRVRVRARLGVTATLSEAFTSGLRLGTGESNSPVSMNQTLGNSGQADFSKLNAWIDRAYIKWEPIPEVSVSGGRFANPWFSTSLTWADDLNFDGIAVQGRYKVSKSFKPFVTVGAFPVENTAFNLPDAAASDSKTASRDKWLLGAQVGTEFETRKNYKIKVGAAYYDFLNFEGDPATCDFGLATSPSNLTGGTCPGDNTRSLFSQKGNSMIPLRIIENAAVYTGNGLAADPQYFGLGSRFQTLALTGQFDLKTYDPVHVVLDTEFVTNLGFSYRDLMRGYDANYSGAGPVNNRDASGNLKTGRVGYLANVTVGMPKLKKLWDWNASLGYRYVEADATPDAFTDSDFHLGGTNAKGFTVGAGLGVAPNVWLTSRWQSSTEVSGDKFAVDIYQVDINARF